MSGAGAAPSGVAPASGAATARTCSSASSGGTGSVPAAGGGPDRCCEVCLLQAGRDGAADKGQLLL